METQAQELIAQIDAYVQSGNSQEISQRLIENKSNITKTLETLANKNVSAAFIGKIGAGKTSAICRVAGLQTKNTTTNEVIDLLKTGAGRTTVCEVRIEHADKISIKIDPISDEEVKKIIHNFSEFIWNKAKRNITDDDEGGSLLSEEVTRCIRNMLGLTIEKKKGDDGKIKSNDKALDFSKNCTSIEEVNELMYQCLSLETRREMEIWPSQSEARDWQQWLKENFTKINDGKNKNIGIPSLITVSGPLPLKRNGFNWKIIDTRGIDSNIHREDIRIALDTEGLFPVICSSFVDAPDADSRSFFDLAAQLGLKNKIARDTLLVILDKNESDKVSDIDEDVNDVKERKTLGRSIREEQVSNKLLHEHKILPTVVTFDSKLDIEDIIWEALDSRRAAYFESKANDLNRLISASNELLNAENAKALALDHDIKTIIGNWRIAADSRSPNWTHFGNYIKRVFSSTHHRTLAASIDRKGEFYNLNVYETINQMARSSANVFCKAEADALREETESLKGKYPEFINQIESFQDEIATSFDQYAVLVGDVAKEHWKEQVKTFLEIWHTMSDEWGRGSGYKTRVIAHWQQWVASDPSDAIHENLLRRVASAWGRVLAKNQG